MDFLLQRPARQLRYIAPEASRGLAKRLADFSDYSVRSAFGLLTPVAVYSARGVTVELSATLVTSKYSSNIDRLEVGHGDEFLIRSSLSIIKTLNDITLAFLLTFYPTYAI
jgi:hypothetical protein